MVRMNLASVRSIKASDGLEFARTMTVLDMIQNLEPSIKVVNLRETVRGIATGRFCGWKKSGDRLEGLVKPYIGNLTIKMK
jgi:hypothetical protein